MPKSLCCNQSVIWKEAALLQRESFKATLWQKQKCSWLLVSSVHGHETKEVFFLTNKLTVQYKRRKEDSTARKVRRREDKGLFFSSERLKCFHFSAEVHQQSSFIISLTFNISINSKQLKLYLTFGFTSSAKHFSPDQQAEQM